MPTYNTFSQLVSGTMNALESGLNGSIGTMAIEEYKASLQQNVYSRPASGDFRTYDLLQAVDSPVERKGNQVSISVFNNPAMMKEEHRSWVDGSSQKDNIVEWLNSGHGYPLYQYPATYFVDFARSEIYNKILNWTITNLKSKGIDARR
jgi:hypothetical protein